MSSHIAYLVLGTNLGNRNKNLCNAESEIDALPHTIILKKAKYINRLLTDLLNNHFFLIWL